MWVFSLDMLCHVALEWFQLRNDEHVHRAVALNQIRTLAHYQINANVGNIGHVNLIIVGHFTLD